MVWPRLIDYKEPTWRYTTLLRDNAIEITNAKTYVFANVTNQSKPERTKTNELENRNLKDLNRIAGEPMEFELKISPGFTTSGILEEIQKIWLNYSVNLSSSKEGSFSCQCTTTLYGREQGNRKMWDEFCYSCESCSQIPARTLVIFGTWIREEMVRDLFW